MLEHPLGVGVPAHHGVGIGQPEGAGQEGALARRQAVHVFLGAVAQHQIIDHQLALDRGHRAVHARIFGRQEADLRDQQ